MSKPKIRFIKPELANALLKEKNTTGFSTGFFYTRVGKYYGAIIAKKDRDSVFQEFRHLGRCIGYLIENCQKHK